MAYNERKMLEDVNGDLIPQYYDPVEDVFKPLTNDPRDVRLTGSIVEKTYELETREIGPGSSSAVITLQKEDFVGGIYLVWSQQVGREAFSFGRREYLENARIDGGVRSFGGEPPSTISGSTEIFSFAGDRVLIYITNEGTEPHVFSGFYAVSTKLEGKHLLSNVYY